VGPVPQQASQVAEICALLPRRTRRRPRPPRVPDPRTQVSEDLLPHPDTELLRPEGSHPASLAPRQHHQAPVGGLGPQPTTRARPRLAPGPRRLTLSAAPIRVTIVKRA